MALRTKEQTEIAFREELQALLTKYNASLVAQDHYTGYPECGEDVRITVEIPGAWDENHDCTQEWTDIDLGSSVFPT
jgi:hypothetical protein